MNIADKMLGAFRQAKYSIQIDNFGRDLGRAGKLLREKFQVLQSFFCQLQGIASVRWFVLFYYKTNDP